MIAVSNISFISALLPEKLVEGMQKEKVLEDGMTAVATLLSNIVLGAIDAYKKREIKKLDPNPGDRACQIRALLLYMLCLEPNLEKEADELVLKIKSIKESLASRTYWIKSLGKKPEQRASGFFTAQFENIAISKQMEFLLQCYLLAQTRQPLNPQPMTADRTIRKLENPLPNGIVRTETSYSLLSKKALSPKIGVLEKELRQKITEIMQANISSNSIELLKIEAEKIKSLPSEEKEHLQKILAETVKYSAKKEFEPKTFGCMFYEYKAILCRLKEERALVCFKSIVPKTKTPFPIILLRSEEVGEEFSLVPDQDYKVLSLEQVVVFDSVINPKYTREMFAQKIMAIGFTKLILEAAAIEDPYQEGSQLEDINDREAQTEIMRYRGYAKQDGCQTEVLYPELVLLDHVYCNTVYAELPIEQKVSKK